MSEESPLIKALPPATDYLTYLTLIEYNLTVENLPILRKVLQDEKLTTNIGWDLVHLLMPLLPESEECLRDIARLGNPREVILKVTEALRLIDFEGLEPDSDEYDEPIASTEAQHSKNPGKTEPVSHEQVAGVTQAAEVPPPPPLPVMQFTILLSMLAILHPRVKTQYPSRFLSTSLQAVLAAFSNAVSHREDLLSASVKFVKAISGTKRPMLPPRKSSMNILATAQAAPAPDPEADATSPSSAEAAIQTKLAYSFVTHVLEEYILTLSSDTDVPGLAWCTRLQEKMHPERTIPGKSMTEKFASDENLHARLTAVGELVALARDLGIKTEDLRSAFFHDDSATLGDLGREDEPPRTAADIPLAKAGSMFLFAAANVSTVLYSSPKPKDALTIFPDHHSILETFVSGSSELSPTVGTEPEAILDAVLALAILTVEANQVGEPKDNEQFNKYLQWLSLISSNSPSPSIRYHAFFLASTILRSNPSDVERLSFIRDTLENCPFENLKVGAISWIKGETIEANPPGSHHSEDHDHASVFATPVALDTLAPYLFPDLTHDLASSSIEDSYMRFSQSLSFYMATLNFYFLLLSATHLHDTLKIGDLHNNNDVGGSFLHPLKIASEKFRNEGKEGGKLEEAWKESGDAESRMMELELLDATLERVTMAVASLNKA